MAALRSVAPSVDNNPLATVMRTTVPGRYPPLGVKPRVVGFGCDQAPGVAGESLGTSPFVRGASGAENRSSILASPGAVPLGDTETRRSAGGRGVAAAHAF